MNYMYLEQVLKKVELCAESEVWIWEIGDVRCEVNPGIERLLVYYFYTGKETKFHELIRLIMPKKIMAKHSPEALKLLFEQTHHVEDIEHFDKSMVPLYADDTNGFWVNGDGKWNLWITKDDERRILDLLKGETPWKTSVWYLQSIARKHALNLDERVLDESLSYFLMQHGLEPKNIRKRDRETNLAKKKGVIKNTTETKHKPDTGIAFVFILLGLIIHAIPIANGITGNLWPFVYLVFNISMIKSFLWQESFGGIAWLFLVFYILASAFYITAAVYTWSNFIIAFTYLFCAAQGIFVAIYSLAAVVSNNKEHSSNQP